MRGCFVTGTDTGAGKTAVAAALAATLRARGERVIALKPILTGTDAPPAPTGPGEEEAWPADDALLAAAGGCRRSQVNQLRFGAPVSPHLAAQLAGGPAIDPARLVAGIQAAAAGASAVVIEGVGGLLVPITATGYTVRDLARQLDLPVVVAARPGLGTISHTLLTLEAGRAADLDIRSVVLTPWPARPGPLERSNLSTIADLGHVPVHVLERVGAPVAEEFVRAAAGLPLRSWLAAPPDRVAA